MKTTQAWGWLTAGSGSGVERDLSRWGAAWAHRMVDRVAYGSTDVAEQVSDRRINFWTG